MELTIQDWKGALLQMLTDYDNTRKVLEIIENTVISEDHSQIVRLKKGDYGKLEKDIQKEILSKEEEERKLRVIHEHLDSLVNIIYNDFANGKEDNAAVFLVEGWYDKYDVFYDYFESKAGERSSDSTGLIKENFDALIQTKKIRDVKSGPWIEYERLLLECQDSIASEDFELAEKYCIQAKEINFDSPQIYEYLALIFFKKYTAEKIIADNLLSRKLTQYIRRFYHFKEYYETKRGENGEDLLGYKAQATANIRIILEDLTRQLKKSYFRLKFEKDDRETFWNYLEIYRELIKIEDCPLEFFERTIVYEIHGLGKVAWFHTNGRTLQNRYPEFDMIAMRSDYMDYLKDDPRIKDYQKMELGVIDQIKNNYTIISRTKNDWDLLRFEIIKNLHNSKVAYLLYNEASVLVHFFDELAGNGIVGLTWFQVVRDKSLINTYHLNKYRKASEFENIVLDPVKDLEFAAQALGLTHELPNVRSKIAEKLIREMEHDVSRKLYTGYNWERTDAHQGYAGFQKSMFKKVYLLSNLLEDPTPVVTKYMESVFQVGTLKENFTIDTYSGTITITGLAQSWEKEDFVFLVRIAKEGNFSPEEGIREYFQAGFEKIKQRFSEYDFDYPDGTYLKERREMITMMKDLELYFEISPHQDYFTFVINEVRHANTLSWELFEIVGDGQSDEMERVIADAKKLLKTFITLQSNFYHL